MCMQLFSILVQEPAMQDQEMLNDLIVESREHLENIEPDLLELEQKGNDVPDDLINRLFRAVHSIKGGFGFFGLKQIVSLSHVMENVMSRIRDKELAVTSEMTDCFFQGVDKLRAMLDDVNNSDSIDINEELRLLEPFLSEKVRSDTRREANGSRDDSVQEIKLRHPSFNEVHIKDAVKEGKLIYQVSLNPDVDLARQKLTYDLLFERWEKFGNIIDTDPKREQLTGEPSPQSEASILIASVLEPDLISEALGVPDERIYTLDLEEQKRKYLRQQEAQEAKSASSRDTARQESKHETRIEEALRVKVSLLNNLMNYASELVLARNQLMQMLSRKIGDSSEAEKVVRLTLETIRAALNRLMESKQNFGNDKQAVETELGQIEKSLREALGFEISDIQGINGIVQNIDMVTSVLQEGIMQTRMQPISVVFSKFPRVIRDLAKKLNKEMSLTQIGQEVELDKSIIELLSDPLTHLVRNCADHGIELPAERRAAGKEAAGEVILRAYQEGGKVIIEIGDDGAGIDHEKVKSKAVEKGIVTPEQAADMNSRESQMLIFAPGFSTATTVSDVSGRGVGMDVVKTNIERLGGTVEVDSQLGAGTKITLKLPLTLAIIPSLIVKSENRRFAVPQVGLEEVVRIRAKDVTRQIECIHNSEVLRLRGKLLPLVRLAQTLGMSPSFEHPETGDMLPDHRRRWSDRRGKPGDDGASPPAEPEIEERRTGKGDRRQSVGNAVKIVVLRMERHLYGLVVDDVLDSEEIVVKALPETLKASQCFAGSTIMGDGRVAMILDPNGIAAMADLKFEDLEKDITAEKKKAENEANQQMQDMLLFTIGGKEHLAMSLAEVARIEKRKTHEIEAVGDKEFLKYDDSTLRIIRLEHFMPISASMEQADTTFVIVPRSATGQIGLIAHKVEDTVQTALELDINSIHGTGVKGSTIINKNLTVVLDIPAIVEAAG
ncbi:MAG: hypothetical protein GF398_03615 [Chitinivibrionales bacterium]|nr:hypothetical protein [Chitinivibrionales bacterium]